jgi:hypothetical protein
MIHQYPAYNATVASESAQPGARDSASPLPAETKFPSGGAEVNGLQLSLYTPHEVKAGSNLPAVLRLRTTRSSAITLLSDDNPSGVDYDFTVTTGDGKPVLPRPDYVKMITRISRETIDAEHPSLMAVDLNKRFDLVPGMYRIHAVRSLNEVVVAGDRFTSRVLTTIVSNTVELIVD